MEHLSSGSHESINWTVCLLFFSSLFKCPLYSPSSESMPYQYSPTFQSLTDRNELIEQYFKLGYSYLEILLMLKVHHGIIVSMRQMKRILKQKGLSRRINHDNMQTVVAKIQEELSGSGRSVGYRNMHQRLRVSHNLVVSRETVRNTLKILDPIGVQYCSRRRLRHREYRGRGPNFIWHLDGYDKLKPYGLYIHGGIDGYSRKILCL